MLNINKRIELLEVKQKFIASKFDSLENKYQNDSASFFNELNSEQYNLQIGLEELFSKEENTQITKNYLKLYKSFNSKYNNSNSNCNALINNKVQSKHINKSNQNLSNQVVPQHNQQLKQITPQSSKNFILEEKSNPDEKITKKENFHVLEHQNQVVLTFDPVDKEDREILINNPNQNPNKIKLDIHKKQNNFLTNELVNLRIKLNKIKGKNKILTNLLKSNDNVKNCKLMEKIIISYIEKLAVNWNDITDLIIEELIEEEVYKLNEIELNKLKHKSDNLISTVRESFREEKYTHPREPLLEINNILSDYINKEDILANKYLNKN